MKKSSLRVRKLPPPVRSTKKKAIDRSSFRPDAVLHHSQNTYPVHIKAGNYDYDWEIPRLGSEPILKQMALGIARMIRRWLKHQYGAVVHIISSSGDKTVRYQRKLKLISKDVLRVLHGIAPQYA